MKTKILNHVLQNWKSGLTVALVSIPLSLALAIASWATPIQGIITAFWAWLIWASLGWWNYNIIWPTWALSWILVSFALVYWFSALPVIAFISGLFILICYILHLDRYIIFIPKSVVHGFTLWVAFIIILWQLNNILWLSWLEKTESLLKNTWVSLSHFAEIQWLIFIIFLLSTIFIFVWDKNIKKIPWSVIIAFLGIFIVFILQKTNFPFQLITLWDQYPNINSSLFENTFFTFDKSILLNKSIWVISVTTAVIAILETLLSWQIAQNMTKVKFNRSKEVFALSIANIVSWLMWWIPATAALARTALNIKSWANHKTSWIISSIIVWLIALFIFFLFKLLPVVIIASILFVVAIRMVEKRHFINLIENEVLSFALSIFVAFVTIAEDPIIGLLLWTFIALLIFANKISQGQTEILLWNKWIMTESILKSEIHKKKKITSDLVVYKISWTLTYLNMPAHLNSVNRIVGNKYVIISLRHAFYADLDGIEYLGELIEILKNNNEKVFLSWINKEIEKLLIKEKFYKQKLIEKKIYDRTSDAFEEIFKTDYRN